MSPRFCYYGGYTYIPLPPPITEDTLTFPPPPPPITEDTLTFPPPRGGGGGGGGETPMHVPIEMLGQEELSQHSSVTVSLCFFVVFFCFLQQQYYSVKGSADSIVSLEEFFFIMLEQEWRTKYLLFYLFCIRKVYPADPSPWPHVYY